MNIFQSLSARMKKAVDSECLPEVNSLVDVTINGVTEHLSVEEVTKTSIEFHRHSRAKAGERMIFSYVNGNGRFRFAAVCASVERGIAACAIPAEITAVETFDNRRREFRYRHVLAVTWRYAPDGKGYGEFTPSTVADLSRGGCLLVVPRALKAGSQLEIRVMLGSGPAFDLIGTLTRPTQPAASGKFLAGLSFKTISRNHVKAIEDYITNRVGNDRLRNLPTAR